MADTPLFELVSNPELRRADIQLYKDGKITWDELLDRAVDTVTGQKVSRSTAAFLASSGFEIDSRKLDLRYAAEFRERVAEGLSSCGQPHEGQWICCSRPEGHQGLLGAPNEHAALNSDTLLVITAWEV